MKRYITTIMIAALPLLGNAQRLTLGSTVTKDGGDVDAITASTITSRAYAQAVENALVAFDTLKAPDATSGATKPVEEGGQSNE